MSTPRRSSLGNMLLRRSKSSDLKKRQREQELQRQRESIPDAPPRLPALYNVSGDVRPDSLAIVSGKAEQYSPQTHRQYPPSGRPSMDPGRPSMSPSLMAAPPVPNGGQYVDPYARTESMTNRGRYSYASSAISTVNNPRRIRRRKDPTPFNVLIMGTRGSGKTSFLEFLKSSLALPPKQRSQRATEIGEELVATSMPSGNFIPHYVESEIDGERIGVTLWDSEGLEKNVVDLQLREMAAFLESKFEETFAEEMKVIRSPGVQDTHIHAVFLILDPARLDRNISAAKAQATNGHDSKYEQVSRMVGGLDEDLDIQVMRTLQGKTTVIPVISKADTITTAHMNVLKRTVWASLKKASFDPLQPLALDEEESNSSRIDEADEEEEAEEEETAEAAEAAEESSSQDEGSEETEEGEELPIQGSSPPSSRKRSSNSVHRTKKTDDESDELPLIPLSIISPDAYEPEIVGRKFPWGFADPYNGEHCDFVKLKDAVFSAWRGDLRELSREQWYEGWRTSRLKHHESAHRRR